MGNDPPARRARKRDHHPPRPRLNGHQARYIGDQAGGRVFLFLATDDFARDHAAFTAAGVEWVRPPATHDYGTVAVFADLSAICGIWRSSAEIAAI
jgi:hypothetical protein